MNTIIKNTFKIATVAAGVWVVRKFELDKKVKEKIEKMKYAQVPSCQEDEETNCNDKNYMGE